MDGKVIKSLARKTKKCRKSGMVRTRTMLIANPRADGLRRAFATSANRDMIRGDLAESKVTTAVLCRVMCAPLSPQDRLGGSQSSLPASGIQLRFDLPLPASGCSTVAYAQPRNCLEQKLNLKFQSHHPFSFTICLYLVN